MSTAYYRSKFKKKAEQFNHDSYLRDYFIPLIGNKKKVRIAEVASGPVNTIGNKVEGVEVEIVCSDINAEEYNEMWVEHKMKPLIPIEYQDIENLTYPDNSFDIVHCENALDHTDDPWKAVEEFKRITKDWVYLRHAEGQKRIYGGHHKHNMEEVKLKGFKTERDGKWILSTWRK